MKSVILVGIVLIALGAAGLVAGEITYKAERETLTVGPMKATVQEEKKVPIPPMLAGLAIVAGVGMVVAGRKKS